MCHRHFIPVPPDLVGVIGLPTKTQTCAKEANLISYFLVSDLPGMVTSLRSLHRGKGDGSLPVALLPEQVLPKGPEVANHSSSGIEHLCIYLPVGGSSISPIGLFQRVGCGQKRSFPASLPLENFLCTLFLFLAQSCSY